MNGKRPSPRTIRLASAGTAAAALVAAFAAVAGAGLSSTSSSASEYQYGPGSHQYGQKVTLCHHTHSKKHPTVTITVGAPAVKALISRAIKACTSANKYVGICGQGPSDHPDFAEWLADEGIASISLNPDCVIETWNLLAITR